MSIQELNREVVGCRRCPRLREWCESVEGTRKTYQDPYWKKPVPGFGERNARLLIVGLAPGAHGANRTGRVFTGDAAGDFLFKALHRHGFANQSHSVARNDSLELRDVFITNAVKCAPPKNRPTPAEFQACEPFLKKELELLPNLKAILALGGKAFNRVKRTLKDCDADVKGMKFGHGVHYHIGDNFPILLGSYHTSFLNINTKRLTPEMIDEVFEFVKETLKREEP
ncbi:MAG TPA: uracil-DNA glycosylase [Bacillales bacterium]|nr:uracil-DNA glycosylase [Bacillales bacterium]